MKLTAEKIAELFGVEVEEDFIATRDRLKAICYVNNGGYIKSRDDDCVVSLTWLLEAEIEKLPWKPKESEKYLFPVPYPCKTTNTFFSYHCESDQWRLAHGLCFKTREEAEAKWRELYGVTE